MMKLAADGGYPLAAAALEFPLYDDTVATVLIGTAKAASLTRNMKLLKTRVDDPNSKIPAARHCPGKTDRRRGSSSTACSRR
jgi:aryl-alcohol dehydrogenase-like predicted oxidoreductase